MNMVEGVKKGYSLLGISIDLGSEEAFPKAFSEAASKASWDKFPAPTMVKLGAT